MPDINFTPDTLDVNILQNDVTLLVLMPSGLDKASNQDLALIRKFIQLDKKLWNGEYNLYRQKYRRGYSYLLKSDKYPLKILILCIQKSRNMKVSLGDSTKDRIAYLEQAISHVVKKYRKMSNIVTDYEMFSPYIDQLDDLVKTYRLENSTTLNITIFNVPAEKCDESQDVNEMDGLDLGEKVKIDLEHFSGKIDKLPVYKLSHLAIAEICQSELILDAKDIVNPEWSDYLFKDKNFQLLKEISDKIGDSEFYPKSKDVFRAFRYKSPSKIKVVILGQDPYYAVGKGEAHGLSFSVNKGVAIPPSLKNIFKALINDDTVPDFIQIPKSGSLIKWAKQGVLLLNSSLTVQPGKGGSHKVIWKEFTDNLIQMIAMQVKPIFVLWGNHAKEKRPLITPYVQSNKILEFGHPSPLGKCNFDTKCKHFGQINKILDENDLPIIDWNL